MYPEDIWAPGILDEEREHRNRWADLSAYGGTRSHSERGWWPDDEGEAYDAEDDLPW